MRGPKAHYAPKNKITAARLDVPPRTHIQTRQPRPRPGHRCTRRRRLLSPWASPSPSPPPRGSPILQVHVEAAPEGAGGLEGRNTIKENWQQNLARSLSLEAWVEQQTIKVAV